MLRHRGRKSASVIEEEEEGGVRGMEDSCGFRGNQGLHKHRSGISRLEAGLCLWLMRAIE